MDEQSETLSNEYDDAYCFLNSGNHEIILNQSPIKNDITDLKPFSDNVKDSNPIIQSLGQKFDYEVKVQARVTNFDTLEEKCYQCDECQYKTKKSTSLRRHIKSIHMLQRRYSCDGCDYKSFHKVNISNHIMKKHDSKKHNLKYKKPFLILLADI